jgi:site-specific DNA-methyltransferase (adenine-specific)
MTPYYADTAITLYHGDWRDVLPHLCLSDKVLYITDPPYGTGGRRRTKIGAGSNPSSSVVKRETWDDGSLDWLHLARGLAAVFWPSARTHALLSRAIECGLTSHRLVYMRKRDPMPQPSKITPFYTEPIWLLSRDSIPFRAKSDMCECSTPREGRDTEATGHPYEKPLHVMTWLVGALPGEFIIDPFAGSGTTLRAAKDRGRRAIGCETSERWCEVAARRCQQEVFSL